MSVNGKLPFIHVEDANGLPHVGAILKVYEATTTTNRAIYSDSALITPFTNPLSGAQASDAAGNFPVFYMQPGLYRLRAETHNGVLIWDWDNLDTGLSVGLGALPIANGGTGASTAPAAIANLGAASASDVTALAAQISTFVSALQALTSVPQGRLTLTSATPVLAASVIAATTVYYTPYTGQLCPVWDGIQFNSKIFAELSLTLNASHVLSSIYDVYLINDSVAGVIIVTGPAWSNIAIGTGSRSGTADLTRLKGILVNAASMTARNGATTYTVAGSQGTYLGSIYMDGTAGQVSCLLAYGQSRKWGVWNAYNRVTTIIKCGDPTASWVTVNPTFRPQNNNTANKITLFCGLPEENFHIIYKHNATNNIANAETGIGYNSITASSGAVSYAGNSYAEYHPVPFIGIQDVTALEGQITAGAVTYSGGEGNMILSAWWRG